MPTEWSFRDYVLALKTARSDTKFFEYHAHRYGAAEYILGAGGGGGIIVDFIARYENRLHDLKYIASRIKLPNLGKLHIQKATPEDTHYSKFYDTETIDIIRKIYAQDIELFNYAFDDQR